MKTNYQIIVIGIVLIAITILLGAKLDTAPYTYALIAANGLTGTAMVVRGTRVAEQTDLGRAWSTMKFIGMVVFYCSIFASIGAILVSILLLTIPEWVIAKGIFVEMFCVLGLCIANLLPVSIWLFRKEQKLKR